MIVPEYTFRPMTRSAMVLERLAAENGQTVAAILSHMGQCPYRLSMLRLCRSAMFDVWDVLDGETGKWRQATADDDGARWSLFSQCLMEDFGQHAACPDCKQPCHPACDGDPFVEVKRDRNT